MVEIDIHADLLRPRRWLIFSNTIRTLITFWRAILTREVSFWVCFYRTPYIFHKIRVLAREYIHSSDGWAFTIQTQSLYDASVPGIPHFVYTDHTHLANLYYPGFSPRKLFSRAWIDLEREIYQNATHVFVMGEHVRQSLAAHYGLPGDRVSCIYAGGNVDGSTASLNNDSYRNQTVAFVGVDWIRKGGPTLLAAWDLVRRRLPNARLLIAGCSPRVRDASIEVIGPTDRAGVKACLERASVACLPSLVEPFGIFVIEACSHRLPVVASNIGAMSDMVIEGETGHLVPPDDPAALAAALLDLLEDPARCQRWGEAGEVRMRDRYSWPAVGDRLHSVIAPLGSPATPSA